MSSAASTGVEALPVPATPRKRGLRLSRSHMEFLPAALEVLETPASPAGRAVAATICLFLVGALIWACVGRVDIVATAQGTVIPAGRSKVVQPLETSEVSAILVNDGDHVQMDQVLFRLDVTIAAAERARVSRELIDAELNLAGLRALLRDLRTGEGLGSFVAPEGGSVDEVAEAKAAAAARRAEEVAKLAALDQQIAGKQAEEAENTATIVKLTASLPWLAQKEQLREELLHNEFGNRLAWLDAEQDLVEGRAALVVQQRHGPEIAAALDALVRQREQTAAEYARDVLKDLADAEDKVGTLRQQLVEAAHKAQQTVLTAPISGTVQQLAIHTIGGIVTPAEPLLTIVPDNAPVLIEATVDNKDIGFVHAGQEVAVKVQTFEFTRYGLLQGHVIDVSRDRVAEQQQETPRHSSHDSADDNGAKDQHQDQPGYTAHIALDKTHMSVDGREEPVAPGMAVTAEIKTGRRTVISYLLSPLRRYAREGIRER
ncbi:MAG TPA: HlyD family type I secretion periplasmic adaptor subunit [Acetobacteraceae bacterium]|nr:HlyD family type I secretion periplasmic adaptor subunit [Acetobacteraceae bacterium]